MLRSVRYVNFLEEGNTATWDREPFGTMYAPQPSTCRLVHSTNFNAPHEIQLTLSFRLGDTFAVRGCPVEEPLESRVLASC